MGAIVNPTDKIVLTDTSLKSLIKNITDQIVKLVSEEQIGHNIKDVTIKSSSEPGGANEITLSFIGDTVPDETFYVYNGSTGPTGKTGAAAGFGNVTATVGSNVEGGTPTVSVSTSGNDTAKNFAFTFSNIKGATGEQGPTGPRGIQGTAAGFGTISAKIGTNIEGETPTVQVNTSGDDISKDITFTFNNIKGNTGPAAFTLSNDLNYEAVSG